MKAYQIPFQETGYFSKIICDYLDKDSELSSFYGNFPDYEGFEQQLHLKSTFSSATRAVLVNALHTQNKHLTLSEATQNNIQLLSQANTFTVTTGHQLCLFTGPLYFLYKIISVINLAKILKKRFPTHHFVPVLWMASEDHDFEEINHFNFNGKQLCWNVKSKGAVGKLATESLDTVFEDFSKVVGTSEHATSLKKLFKEAYLTHLNLAVATRFLVNELFSNYGLVIIDGDDKQLKQVFKPIVASELQHQTSYTEVSKTINLLQKKYKIQVNPREINLFYLKNRLRERIVFKEEQFFVNNTSISFSKDEIIAELEQYPERFSPNVIMRPLYQETILPNICYVGGGGELAYWLELKQYFETVETPFPILLLRNSVLLTTAKQRKKLAKLHISFEELFLPQSALIDKKIKEISAIKIDFSTQKAHLKKQFIQLKELAKQTDITFLNAVNAQEKKQIKGLEVLEKRLLKAQKRKLATTVAQITRIQNELFPQQQLEERVRNFSELYVKQGDAFIANLIEVLNPLQLTFTVAEM